MNTFKFRSNSNLLGILNYSNRSNQELDYFHLTNKPNEIPDCCVRNGEYIIRGKVKNSKFIFIYQLESNKWYYIDDNRIPSDEYIIADWQLYPNIDPKIYEKLSTIPSKYLSKKWKIYLYAYNINKKLSKLSRDNKLRRYKIIGK